MNDHDENLDNGTPDHVVNPSPEAPAQIAPPVTQPVAESQAPHVLAGDPMAATLPAFQANRILPEDLRVSWSWPHLIVFIFFGFASLMVVQLGFVFYVSANRHLSAVQVQRVFENSPQLLVETNVLWYALLFLFLYVTLAVLRDMPFWRSLGWRKLNVNPTAGTGNGWMYFFSGCGLAIFVALASYNMKDTEHLPIQEIFKNRSGAMLLMAMAVLVAPLVEETVFRGYARNFDHRRALWFDARIPAWLDMAAGVAAEFGWCDFYFRARAHRHSPGQLPAAFRLQLHDRTDVDYRHQRFSAYAYVTLTPCGNSFCLKAFATI
jgi:membrane protease YdiL (CAAX protease family)